ncbi:MAG: hypothetical protein ACOCP4_07640 [Candidatus Woesearchaeota archaeon]
MIALRIFTLLVKAFILFPFSHKHRIIIKPLLKTHNFRFSASMQGNIKAPFIYLKKAVTFLFKKKHGLDPVFANNSVAIFDGRMITIDERYKYLISLNTVKPGFGISRENLSINDKKVRNTTFLITIILFIIISPLTLFTRTKKGTISILLIEFVEWVALIEKLRQKQCTYMYHFCAYENDSNFIAYLNRKMKIINHKIPSSNPISNHYKYLYCDNISFTAPFQKNESNFLKKNWIYKKEYNWPIENFQNLLPILKKQKTIKYDIGIMLSGFWLRVKNDHNQANQISFHSEHLLLKFLNQYVSDNPRLRLIILLHPIEKKNITIYNEACLFYRKYFPSIEISIGSIDKESYEYFPIINTSLTTKSSSNIKRLFCGLKAIYAPFNYSSPFIDSSSLKRISAKNKNDFFSLLNKSLNLNNEEFFSYFNIYEYHYSTYQHNS